MNFLVGILTLVLVFNALLLILLVLVQLPKKDAGAGMAFGAGTADALFGAGSGNALTKITKNATVVFLVLALFLGYLHDRVYAANSTADFAKQVSLKAAQTPSLQNSPTAQPTATVPAAPGMVPATQPPAGNLLSTLPVQTNAPAPK
jgi:protein translocase SecG subunit